MRSLKQATASAKKIQSMRVHRKEKSSRNPKRNAGYPSITAARVVHVNPMAIPIHGVWPSVPSLRTWCVLVAPRDPRDLNRTDPIDDSPGTLVATAVSGSSWGVCAFATWACWRPSWSLSFPPCNCRAGSGVGGVAFGSDGVASTAGVAVTATGRRKRRVLESFIAVEHRE
jgi:hypothetical protein